MITLFFSLLFATLPRQEVELLGEKIFQNECGSKTEKLVWWNAGENFASLGIGHFIWYPESAEEIYVETFPLLLEEMQSAGISIPEWIIESKTCPWASREAFLDPAQESKKKELRAFLTKTIREQAQFIDRQFDLSLKRILADLSEDAKEEMQQKIEQLSQTVQGRFALIDYCNFKGDGTQDKERYLGKGWGLKQVLSQMPVNAKNPLEAFASTAKALLLERVKNSPPERNEAQWLSGWNARIDRYLKL